MNYVSKMPLTSLIQVRSSARLTVAHGLVLADEFLRRNTLRRPGLLTKLGVLTVLMLCGFLRVIVVKLDISEAQIEYAWILES